MGSPPPQPATALTVKLAPGAWRTESWSPPGGARQDAIVNLSATASVHKSLPAACFLLQAR